MLVSELLVNLRKSLLSVLISLIAFVGHFLREVPAAQGFPVRLCRLEIEFCDIP
jgi:hypothetical protein